MPSTNKTANFKLNQWQRSDGVSMDDFNSDNQKLEAALNASPWVRVAGASAAADAASVTLDLSGLDLSGYAAFKLICIAATDAAENYSNDLQLRVNGLDSGYTVSYTHTESYPSSHSSAFVMVYANCNGQLTETIIARAGSKLHFVTAQSHPVTIGVNYGAITAHIDIGSSPISSLSLHSVTAASPLKAGTKMILLGLKM